MKPTAEESAPVSRRDAAPPRRAAVLPSAPTANRAVTRWPTSLVLALCAVLAAAGFMAARRASAAARATAANARAGVTPSAVAGRASGPSDLAAGEDASGEASGTWEERWRETLGGRSTPARNQRLAALIEALAKTDPQRALALARSMADWRLRDLLRNAALRGWAEVKPEEAADWALNSPSDDRRAVVEAVMAGAARHPAAAVKVALRLCASDGERAGDYGHYTIAALVDGGAFDAAVQFGLSVDPEKYPFLLRSAFFQWARNQPAAALAAVDAIADPALKAKARTEALVGWSWADPKGLTDFAMTLPPGSDRTSILNEALARWVERDPAAAAQWIGRAPESPELDAGVVALAHQQALITQQPTLAMQLAGSINDPKERSHTLRAVFRQWATTDAAAARQFLAGTPKPEDRAVLEAELKDLFPDG